jgi:hypothetical protein
MKVPVIKMSVLEQTPVEELMEGIAEFVERENPYQPFVWLPDETISQCDLFGDDGFNSRASG